MLPGNSTVDLIINDDNNKNKFKVLKANYYKLKFPPNSTVNIE